MEEKKNERLELRPESMDTLESKLLVRKKPKMFKIENSSALSRVKAFMPEIKKAEVDLWQQMKIGVRPIESHSSIRDVLLYYFREMKA